MKEQNKPETAIDWTPQEFSDALSNVKILVEAGRQEAANHNFEPNGSFLYGFQLGANWQSTQMYSREDCEKMLEALRQSILDLEVLREVNTCRIEDIDVHQFIPPLTK